MSEQVAMIDEQRMREAGLSPEALRAAAREDASRWSTIRQPQDAGALGSRIDAAREHLNAVAGELDPLPTEGWPGPEPLLEIRENPRMMRSVFGELHSVRRKLRRLPWAVALRQEEPRTAAVAAGYLAAAHSVWNADALRIYLTEFQQTEPLLLEELWVLPVMLRFVLLEQVLEQAEARLQNLSLDDGTPRVEAPNADADAALLKTRIQALRDIAFVDWYFVMEPLVVFDAILREDPTGAYARMDFDSREVYRKEVARIARFCDCTEIDVARNAIQLARAAQQQPVGDARVYLRRTHVGYYLIDDGFEDLRSRISYHPRMIDRLRSGLRRHADDYFIGGIEVLTVILIAAVLLPLVPNYSIFGGLTVAFLLLLIPATQGAVDVVNNAVSSLFLPKPLPKLDFSETGIPPEYTTMVVVPTLLLNEQEVRDLVQDLEVRCLANPDPNLHFALLTDLPDSVSRPRESDRDPLVDLAIRLIDDLNARYQNEGKYGHFLLLHRHRVFNARQGVWMGWERKRGKLLDLNKLLKGEFDAFPVKAGDMSVLHRVQYIITLDSDTQLPRGTAHGMVGAMAHPLNRAIIDPDRRIVTKGYGILQPRVGVSVRSAARSRMASIYSGQTGFDIYTRAISDVYQDLYGEGSFTGKGIYEVNALHAVLERRFPRNSLLSHDLIEGAYARAGLATDIEIIDDYPSHYSAYTRRKHRWVRGDWQIAQWLFSRVPDESGKFVKNPISTISRWKILDNLRRSLVEPMTMVLLVAGWLGLPGGALYWTLVTLFLLFLPPLVQLVFGLGRAAFVEQEGASRDVVTGFHQAIFTTFLTLAFLPHQTMMAIDAIVRALVRRMVTGQRLLEWETAAEAESATRRITAVDRYLNFTPIVAAILALVIAVTHHPFSLVVAGPILILWGFERDLTIWLNKPPREPQQQLSREDELFLREYALKVWRFFYEFGGARHNYLIPDNVEEAGIFEAARVSPTNLGLLFNARQAACEFGFLTAPEYTQLMQASYATIAKLPMYRGHLYNWYTTDTLEPLTPITVSSVDSGNWVASLYTVRTGTLGLLKRPLLDARLFSGLEAHLRLLQSLDHVPQPIAVLRPPTHAGDLNSWVEWIFAPETEAAFADVPPYEEPSMDELLWWSNETRTRIHALQTLVRNYLPWLCPEYSGLEATLHEKLIGEPAGQPDGPRVVAPGTLQTLPERLALPSLEETPQFVAALEQRLSRPRPMPESGETAALVEKLRGELTASQERAGRLVNDLRAVSAEAGRLGDNTEFAFLVNKDRMLLSIGYELATDKVHWACYDMLASEARIATYIAVARGELSQQGWFKMSRVHTQAYGRSVLLSWTGTMFEYLMPALWMRSYPDTLMSKSLYGAVAIQRAYGREHGIPWGISESGYAAKTDEGHYHYQAYGIPQIALKWDATAGPVVSPYSSFLALVVEPQAAIENLRRMARSGWTGPWGFFEAIDFMQGKNKPQPVREWMAHHQGMCIVALLNLLNDNIVQQWFYENTQMRAVELLLHEKPMRESGSKGDGGSSAPKKATKKPRVVKRPAALKKAG